MPLRLAILLCLGILGCGRPEPPPAPRSAILLIADGLGPSGITAARIEHAGPTGALHLDRLPHTALVRTHSANNLVTDSAAAATAMACGRKTVNGVLGEDETAVLNKAPGVPIQSLAEWAAARGMLVALVTNTTVTHATPAAWYAHIHARNDEAQIAQQLRKSPVHVVLGGGAKFFPAAQSWQPWRVVRSAKELPEGPIDPATHLLGVFAEEHLPYEGLDAPREAPTLLELSRWALRGLQASSRPFLLMIEGGRIDHAGHDNWARTLLHEVVAFDEVVGHVTATADPATTLVLVTSDHETGGLSLNGYPALQDGVWGRSVFGSTLSFSSGPGIKKRRATLRPDDARASLFYVDSAVHTGTDVTLYGWGEGAEAVRGTLDNTEVYRLLKAQLQKNSATIPHDDPSPTSSGDRAGSGDHGRGAGGARAGR
jgi:alkaline phosphatase